MEGEVERAHNSSIIVPPKHGEWLRGERRN